MEACALRVEVVDFRPEPVLRSDYGFYPISLPLDATTLMISKVAAVFKEVSVVLW